MPTPRTLVVVNPQAANGRAIHVHTQIEPLLRETFGDLETVVTGAPSDVETAIEAAGSETDRVIAIGGDGTNHAIINALARFQERHPEKTAPAYGAVPVGTGRDWARGIGVPLNNPAEAVRWLGRARAQPVDIGLVLCGSERVYFLNIGSAGIGYDIARQVNALPRRRPWSFLQSTVEAIITHRPQHMEIALDGEPWYAGRAYEIIVANGGVFGHGMKIAPDASIRDGLFDVVLIEGASRATILTALPRVYFGTHLSHPAVRFARAREVDVSAGGAALGVELDGETISGETLSFRVCPGLLRVLLA